MPSEQAITEQSNPLSVWIQESIGRYQQKSRPTMGLTMDIHPILAQLSRSRGLEGMTTVLTKMYIQDSTGVIHWVRNQKSFREEAQGLKIKFQSGH